MAAALPPPVRPRRGCLSGCGTVFLIVVGIAAIRGVFFKSTTDVSSTSSLHSDATPSAAATVQPGPSARPANRPPAKGDRAQLVRGTPLYFRDSVYRQATAGEQFEVIEYHPETKKVYLLSRGADGKPLACNVPAEAITIVSFAPQPAAPLAPLPTAKPQPRYEIVKRWAIPNDGEGEHIVISSSLATDAGMKAIGEKLREDTSSDRIVFVLIFDDIRAEQMYDRMDNLSPAEDAFYDRHFMGRYMRNATNGVHEMDSHPSGMSGPSRTITF